MPETDSALRDGLLPADLLPAAVRQMVRLVAPHRTERVTAEHQLIGDLGFHSLALAELGFTLEDLFGLDAITPERAMALRTVGDLVALIEGALAEDAARLPSREEVEAVCAQYGAAWDPEA
ncbi:acyl carrier protein [Actinocrinis puniceicyclus]|uniref:Acyl carrier protein n=1 Tax=Actinocrinis puniceicyclus TaxID=977794 RepID=A0A8J7WRW0_9ACTN|nr:acyl carrier protein [Actinocrinis puniceicyclus]MBS2965024.1 acyl carrier protein [Actinocrinis puniceicyclus]